LASEDGHKTYGSKVQILRVNLRITTAVVFAAVAPFVEMSPPARHSLIYWHNVTFRPPVI
jgi:hypothetical protein